MAKRAANSTARTKPAASAKDPKVDEVVYRLHTLLHTMRAIERHEEALCALMTEIQKSGAVTADQDEEIRDLLEQMPCHEYGDDVEAVRASLSPAILEPASRERAAR